MLSFVSILHKSISADLTLWYLIFYIQPLHYLGLSNVQMQFSPDVFNYKNAGMTWEMLGRSYIKIQMEKWGPPDDSQA